MMHSKPSSSISLIQLFNSLEEGAFGVVAAKSHKAIFDRIYFLKKALYKEVIETKYVEKPVTKSIVEACPRLKTEDIPTTSRL